jgi:hypothetical protein
VYATAYGLLVYATGERGGDEVSNSDSSSFNKVLTRMKSWIYDFF